MQTELAHHVITNAVWGEHFQKRATDFKIVYFTNFAGEIDVSIELSFYVSSTSTANTVSRLSARPKVALNVVKDRRPRLLNFYIGLCICIRRPGLVRTAGRDS